MRLASESKPKLAMPRYGVPSTLATSISRSSPSTASRAACGGVARDAEHAGEVVAAPAGDQRDRGAGALERAGERAQQAVAADRGDRLARPRGARAASSAACSMLRVVTVRWGAPRRSSSAITSGSAFSARPPPEAGFTSSAKRRLTRPPLPRGRARRRPLPARLAAQVRRRVDLADVGLRRAARRRSGARRGAPRGRPGRARAGRPAGRCASARPVTFSEATSSWPGRCSQCRSNRPSR